MTKLILIAVLFFTANVAGAEQPARKGWKIYETIGYSGHDGTKEYRCIFNESGKEAYCVLIKKEQPEAITADKVRDLCQDKCHLDNVAVVESDAEKWRKKCDEYHKKFEDNLGTGIEYRYMQQANYYCTRAVLEELRK